MTEPSLCVFVLSFDLFIFVLCICSVIRLVYLRSVYLFCHSTCLSSLCVLKGNSEGVKWRTNKKDIKGELRRCKVKNRQKSYRSSLYTFWVPLWYLFCLLFTLHLLSTPLISFLLVLHFTPSEFTFDIFCVCSSLYTWVPLWYLFCLFFTLHLLDSPLITFLFVLHFTPSEFSFDIFKGELRRCKVRNRQKRYQRATQKV
jgi:hypothetical protein